MSPTVVVEKSVFDNNPHMLEIIERGNGEVSVRVYKEPGPQGGQGNFLAGVRLKNKEQLLDMIVALWPDNVAYQFDTEKKS